MKSNDEFMSDAPVIPGTSPVTDNPNPGGSQGMDPTGPSTGPGKPPGKDDDDRDDLIESEVA